MVHTGKGKGLVRFFWFMSSGITTFQLSIIFFFPQDFFKLFVVIPFCIDPEVLRGVAFV